MCILLLITLIYCRILINADGNVIDADLTIDQPETPLSVMFYTKASNKKSGIFVSVDGVVMKATGKRITTVKLRRFLTEFQNSGGIVDDRYLFTAIRQRGKDRYKFKKRKGKCLVFKNNTLKLGSCSDRMSVFTFKDEENSERFNNSIRKMAEETEAQQKGARILSDYIKNKVKEEVKKQSSDALMIERVGTNDKISNNTVNKNVAYTNSIDEDSTKPEKEKRSINDRDSTKSSDESNDDVVWKIIEEINKLKEQQRFNSPPPSTTPRIPANIPNQRIPGSIPRPNPMVPQRYPETPKPAQDFTTKLLVLQMSLADKNLSKRDKDELRMLFWLDVLRTKTEETPTEALLYLLSMRNQGNTDEDLWNKVQNEIRSEILKDKVNKLEMQSEVNKKKESEGGDGGGLKDLMKKTPQGSALSSFGII